jgi:hypothetical protein
VTRVSRVTRSEDDRWPERAAIKGLLLGYLGIGIAALVVVILLRNHPAVVNAAAWVRSIIVVATALILLSAAMLGVALLANGRTARARFAL